MREDIIKDQILCWTRDNIDPDFQFRKYQLEAIITVVENYLTGAKTQVMEAPTGAGKSFIAIIAAGTLWQYYQVRSYILASDLSLYKQYEDAIQKYHLPWAALKGRDNYICPENGKKISLAKCSCRNYSPSRIYTATEKDPQKFYDATGLECSKNCPYLQAMIEAEHAPIVLTTYALYLLRLHEYATRGPQTRAHYFLIPREFVIGDEAHNLPSIVQGQFSPEISLKDVDLYDKVYDFLFDYGATENVIETSFLKEAITYTIKFDRPDQLKVCIVRINEIIATYSKAMLEISNNVRHSDLAKYGSLSNSLANQVRSFSSFASALDDLPNAAIVKTINKDKDGVKFNCAYESNLVRKYFHEVSGKELLLSATIGDVDIYKQTIGEMDLDDTKFKPIEIPSTFDFSQSPIYYDTRYKMSYKEKAHSLPFVIDEVVDICDKNSGKRGIIQTGSYDVANSLLNGAPLSLKKRLIPYHGSKDKDEAIKAYLKSTDGILCGPSLLEGLDFAGDKCRFNIFMKMPYASLGDNLVKAKMKLIPGWYSLDVCSKLAQGIGRGVRFNTDWCNTYILDACFADIIRNKSSARNLSETIHKRLVKVN